MSRRRTRTSAAIACSAAVMIAACSEQEGATPDTTPVSLASTTTEPAPATAPPASTTTTTTSTTTTTTIAPTTTAAPVPTGDPTDVATPVFVGSDLDAWLYLGRWDGASWERSVDDAGDQVAFDLTGRAEVTIGELAQTPVAGTVGEPGEACFDEATGPILGPDIAPNAGVPDVPGFGYRAVAAPVSWPLHPREAVQIDDTIQAYADAGVAAFADTGVETQAGEVDQTVVVDLDGDGDTEVLVVFGHEAELAEGQAGPPSGFSALLLGDADSREVVEIAKSFTPLPVEGDDPASLPAFDSYRVLDIADLNGDGIAEVVVHSWFVGGAAVTVYSYDGSTLTDVLSAGCGT